jgi:hypothetical protein
MTSLRIRRRARALCLRGLRVVRRHHFSLLSLAILGATLTIALTSSSFEIQGNAPSEAAALPPAPQSTTTAGFTQPVSTADPETRSVVYYFVSSQDQINDMHQALHRDLVDDALVGYKALHNVTRVFILVEDYRDEGDALELIRQQALMPMDGFTVQMVDLR